MNSNRDHDSERLLRAKQFYEDILAVAIQMQQLMESENEQIWPMAKIMKLQDKRQDIMQRIDELDSSGESLAFSDQQQLKNNTIMSQIREIIMEIQEVDRSCRVKLEEGKRKTKGKIMRARESKKAQIAYNQGGNYASACFIDKKR